MSKFNHAFSVGFSLENELENGHDTPLKELLAAMQKRIQSLKDDDHNAAREAFECFDTYVVED